MELEIAEELPRDEVGRDEEDEATVLDEELDIAEELLNTDVDVVAARAELKRQSCDDEPRDILTHTNVRVDIGFETKKIKASKYFRFECGARQAAR